MNKWPYTISFGIFFLLPFPGGQRNVLFGLPGPPLYSVKSSVFMKWTDWMDVDIYHVPKTQLIMMPMNPILADDNAV